MSYQLDQVFWMQLLTENNIKCFIDKICKFTKAKLWIFQYVNRGFFGCCFIWRYVFHTIFCNILRNSLKGEFYVYFDFLLYLKYTWMFRKSNYNLFNLSWLLKYLPIYFKRFSESVDGSKYELKDSAVSWFSEINLSFSINVTLAGHHIKVCSRNMVCKFSKWFRCYFKG